MATKTLPDHGTLTRRKTYACKCPDCRACDRNYMNTRSRLMAYGRWQPLIDAEPVRAHVRMLMTYGIGWQRVCLLSGVSNGGVSRLLYGDKTRGYVPSKRVRTTTADKLLAVRPALESVAPRAHVDGTGTRRRLQALVANGWPQMRLGAELGLNHYRMIWDLARSESVTGATVRRVMALYDDLWNVDPASRGVAPRYIAQAKRIARANRWAPPGAWDDDYIDSPAAEPDLGDDVDRYTAIAENANWLMDEHSYTRQQAAHRLGITSRHLERALAHGRELEVAA